MEKHFRSDGNGGFRVSSVGLAGIVSFIILLSVFANAVVYGASLRNDVDNLEGYAKANVEDHKEIEERLDSYSESTARVEEQLKAIHEDLDDVQEDIKYLRYKK